MSADCPHRIQLDRTFVEFQKQTTLLATIQSDYIRIIGELKSELDTLSCQVTILDENISNIPASPSTLDSATTTTTTTQQKDININFIQTLQDLEHQNDLLQAALVRATKNREDYWLELEEKNAYLQNQIVTMRDALAGKNKLIVKQSDAIAKLSIPSADEDILKDVRNQLRDAYKRIQNLEKDLDHCRNSENYQIRETRKITDDLIDSKQKNGQLITQIERLRTLLNDGTDNYETLRKKYETLSKTSEQQSKKIQSLEQRIAGFQTSLSQDCMETKLLQHQLSALRQKDATTNGELKALQERYYKLEGELRHSTETISKIKSYFHQKEDQYIRSLKHQEEVNVELGKNLKSAREQLEKLRKQYENKTTDFSDLSTISFQQAETIESYNKWKTEQRKADNMTRESIQKYENYVKLLTEQNKSCLERCRSLHENNQILTDEIKRLRVSTLSTNPGVFTPMNMISPDYPVNLVNILQRMQQTTERVHRQKLQFINGLSGHTPPGDVNYISSDDVFSNPKIITTETFAPPNSNPNQQFPATKSPERKGLDSNKSSITKPP